jgi:hypothetical protein
MDPGTETNNNGKCVRIAPSTAPSASSAIKKAKFLITFALVLLPSAVKTLAYKFNAKFLELSIQLPTLIDSTKASFLQEDFIPHLANINFDLSVTKRVKEQAGTEYQAIAKQASYALAVFQNMVKQKVARVVELENKVCKDKIA